MNLRKIVLWITKLAICILFFMAGYLCNDNAGKYEYGFYNFPIVPKLPKNAPAIFQEYEFYDLNMAGSYRNKCLYDFHKAWTNKETYGFYDIGVGLDDLIHSYWLTDNGKVFYLEISDHGSNLIEKRCYIDELQSVSFYHIKDTNDNSMRVPIDPNTLKNLSIYIDSNHVNRKEIIID